MPQYIQYILELPILILRPRGYYWNVAATECRFPQRWSYQIFDLIVLVCLTSWTSSYFFYICSKLPLATDLNLGSYILTLNLGILSCLSLKYLWGIPPYISIEDQTCTASLCRNKDQKSRGIVETLIPLSYPIVVPHSLRSLGVFQGIYLPLICIPICCIFPFLIVTVTITHMLVTQRIYNDWYFFKRPRSWIYGEVTALRSCKSLEIHLWRRLPSLECTPIGLKWLELPTFSSMYQYWPCAVL